jgi:two-component system chemotaxis response regulator CheY
MRTLIVEDDSISSTILENTLSIYGRCDIAVNGREAVDTFHRALNAGKPYDLICMDIMMPELDGQEALRLIRDIEKEAGRAPEREVTVVMTTALSQTEEVAEALYLGGAAAFFVKPINMAKFIEELILIGLIEEQAPRSGIA